MINMMPNHNTMKVSGPFLGVYAFPNYLTRLISRGFGLKVDLATGAGNSERRISTSPAITFRPSANNKRSNHVILNWILSGPAFLCSITKPFPIIWYATKYADALPYPVTSDSFPGIDSAWRSNLALLVSAPDALPGVVLLDEAIGAGKVLLVLRINRAAPDL